MKEWTFIHVSYFVIRKKLVTQEKQGYEAKLIVFNIWKVWVIFSLATMQVTSWLCFHLLATEKNNPAAWKLPFYWCKSHLKKSTFGNWPPHGWLLADTHHSIYNPISNWIQASLGSYSQLYVTKRPILCHFYTHISCWHLVRALNASFTILHFPFQGVGNLPNPPKSTLCCKGVNSRAF